MSADQVQLKRAKEILSQYYTAINASYTSNGKLKSYIALAQTPKIIFHKKMISDFVLCFRELYQNSHFLFGDSHGINIAYRIAEHMDTLIEDNNFAETTEQLFVNCPLPYLVEEDPEKLLTDLWNDQTRARARNANNLTMEFIALTNYVDNFEKFLVYISSMLKKVDIANVIEPSIVNYLNKIDAHEELNRVLTKEEALPVI